MSLLLIAHIILLAASLVATTGITTASFLSKNVPSRLVRLNLIATLIGVGCGGLLLLTKPLGSECLALLSYLAIFSAAHYYAIRVQQRLQQAQSA